MNALKQLVFNMERACLRSAAAALLGSLALGAVTAHAAQRIPQVAESGVVQKKLSLTSTPITKSTNTLLAAAPQTRVCATEAKWVRLGFSALELKSYDSLTLVSNGGDTYTFEGDNWKGRAFDARAMRGDCVEVKASFASADSRFAIDHYQFGKAALADTPVVVVGAGDICDSSGSACVGTSDLIFNMSPAPDAVFTAGDNAYSNGTLAEFNKNYEPSWGRFKGNTHPTPGNHEYNTAKAQGYFDYFNGANQQTGPAGDRSKGYYSWDVGEWHFVALNTMSGGAIAADQLSWLKADLAGTTKPCVAAYWHHPLVSVGNYSPGVTTAKPLVDALYAAHADLMLVGHDHNYQRFAKMDGNIAAKADGVREILVGTGGRYFYPLKSSKPANLAALLEAGNADTWGILKLTLTASGYQGDFVPSAKGDGTKSNGKFTDTFSDSCNQKVATYSVSTDAADVTVKQGASAAANLTVTSLYGFAGATNLSVTGLPTGVTAAFSSSTVNVAANGSASSTLTLTAAADAPIGAATITVSGNAADVTRVATFKLNVGPADGSCGIANGKLLLTAPAAANELCQVGTASGVTGSGHPWSWSCNSDSGGANAACSATIQSWAVNAVTGPGGGGTVAVANPTVDNGLTTTVTVVADAGFSLASISGCGVVPGADAKTYVTAPVTAQCTVTASFKQSVATSILTVTMNPAKPVAGKPLTIVATMTEAPAADVKARTQAQTLASMTKAAAAAVASGNVTFSDNGKVLSSTPLGSNGQASVSLTQGLTEGAHTIVASYDGDASHAAVQVTAQLQVSSATDGTPLAVPTLSQWALVLLGLLLMYGVWGLRRK